jgi:PAS domain S-box-containing protein
VVRSKSASEIMTNPHSQPSALVINDNPAELHLAATIIARDGFDVIRCSGAEQALAALSERAAVDVIVTDLYMPGIDGWRLCRLLRSSAYRSFNSIPIVVVSATFSGADAEEITAQLGADAFLPAPYAPHELRKVVRDLLGNTKPKRLTNVLIIEPDPFEAEMLTRVFKANGYAVTHAGTGADGLRQLGRNRPQIVILESDLPDMRGDRLLEVIKEPAATTVAIVVTADTSATRALELVRKGADNYVLKPLVPDYLLHLCETASRQRALTRVEELLELRTGKLRHSEERYRNLFENAGVAIAIYSVDGTVISVNHAFEDLTERSRDDVVGKLYRHFLTPAAYAAASQKQSEARAKKMKSWTQEIELAHARGSMVPVEARLRFLRDQDDHTGMIMAVYRDLTAEKQLLRQRAEFSAMLAHDIRNPVGLILGCVSLLLDGGHPPEPELVQTLLQRILDHGRVLQALVTNYLDVSTIEAGRLVLNKKLVNLCDLLRRVAHRFEFEARQRGIRFDQVFAECPLFDGDVLAIERVVTNLLQNAFKFTADRGQIRINLEWRDPEAVISVLDTGPGIDPEKLSSLFQKFQRIEIIERQDGIGLGLYIVKQLVEAHSGRVEVESTVGKGSSFSVFFPVSLGASRDVAAKDQFSKI